MKNVSIQGPVGQTLAAAALTRGIRSKFNLYPDQTAKGILEESRKENVHPLDALEFLETELPGMVTGFLAEVRRIVEDKGPKKGRKVVSWSAILRRYTEKLVEIGGYTEFPEDIMQNMVGEFGIGVSYITSRPKDAGDPDDDDDFHVPKDSPLTKNKKLGDVVEHKGKKLIVVFCDDEEIHVIPAESVDLTR